MEEALIVPLELVVEHDSPDPAASVPQSLLRALVGAIDLGVVRQLPRLPETSVEGLAGLVRAVVALVSVGFEEIPPALGQDHGAIVGTERLRRISPSSLEMRRLRRELSESSRRSCRSVSDTTRNAPTVASIRLSSPLIS